MCEGKVYVDFVSKWLSFENVWETVLTVCESRSSSVRYLRTDTILQPCASRQIWICVCKSGRSGSRDMNILEILFSWLELAKNNNFPYTTKWRNQKILSHFPISATLITDEKCRRFFGLKIKFINLFSIQELYSWKSYFSNTKNIVMIQENSSDGFGLFLILFIFKYN